MNKTIIENIIYDINGKDVMLDSDIALLYGIETKRINETVKRHIDKFKDNYYLLSKEEYTNLKSQFATSSLSNYGGRRTLPYIFTEEGIKILNSIIRVKNKEEVAKEILKSFENKTNSKLSVITDKNIEKMIYEVRGKQVMLDVDVAYLFGYETKNLNRQVQRNSNRFPIEYCFKLTKEEFQNLRCQNVTSSFENKYGGRRSLPNVFTEYGITMLAGILKSEIATQMSIKIVNTFISMRKYLSNSLIEQSLINNMVLRHEENFKIVHNDIRLLQESFDKLEEKRKVNEIYFKGQIFDAYSKIIEIFKTAKQELIIIDRYVDITLLDMIKNIKCNVILITKDNNRLTNLDISRYNSQYHNLKVIYNDDYHDRYFIIDKSIIYHSGTSINHAGSRTFSINILEDKLVKEFLINNIKRIIGI